MEDIYKNIKYIAKKKNIQQKDIAEAFKVTEQTMTNYLTGRTKITADQIPMFAKVLRVQIGQLFQEVGTPLNTSYQNEDKMRVAEESGPCPLCAEKEKRIADKEDIIKGLKGQIELLGFQQRMNRDSDFG